MFPYFNKNIATHIYYNKNLYLLSYIEFNSQCYIKSKDLSSYNFAQFINQRSACKIAKLVQRL